MIIDKQRKRKIIWFNLPSVNVKTNIFKFSKEKFSDNSRA